jgi:hypothetical protein
MDLETSLQIENELQKKQIQELQHFVLLLSGALTQENDNEI